MYVWQGVIGCIPTTCCVPVPQVYFPYLLMNKKRYAGLLWTQPDKFDKMDSKVGGLEEGRGQRSGASGRGGGVREASGGQDLEDFGVACESFACHGMPNVIHKQVGRLHHRVMGSTVWNHGHGQPYRLLRGLLACGSPACHGMPNTQTKTHPTRSAPCHSMPHLCMSPLRMSPLLCLHPHLCHPLPLHNRVSRPCVVTTACWSRTW